MVESHSTNHMKFHEKISRHSTRKIRLPLGSFNSPALMSIIKEAASLQVPDQLEAAGQRNQLTWVLLSYLKSLGMQTLTLNSAQ